MGKRKDNFAHPHGGPSGSTPSGPRRDNFAHSGSKNRTGFRSSNATPSVEKGGFLGAHVSQSKSPSDKLGTKEFSHPGHTTIASELVANIKLTVFVAVTFAIVLAIAATYTNATVASNAVSGVVVASGIFVVVIFVAAYEVVHYMVTHGIGRPEGREF